MTVNIIFKNLIFAFSILFCCIACGDDDASNPETSFGIFNVIDDNTIEMNGEINSSTLSNFNDLIDSYPNISKINIKEVPGSTNDEVNLQVSLKVYERNISTHLSDNGLIASGGVDFFLAGTTRTMGNDTQIGVHSWSDGTNEASDFPEGHANHQPYIDYYQSIGFTQTDAETFYYFTINAASAEDIHWMTTSEIEQYNILKP